MPFRQMFDHVLSESNKELDEDKRGRRMDQISLKQHYLTSKFNDGEKIYNTPDDLKEVRVVLPDGKIRYVKGVSKELDAEGYPLKVLVTIGDEDNPKKGVWIDAANLMAPQEVSVASVDITDNTAKRIAALLLKGKNDAEVLNDLFDPTHYEHSPENEEQVKQLIAKVRETDPTLIAQTKAKQVNNATKLVAFKQHVIDLAKSENISPEAFLKELDQDWDPELYSSLSDIDIIEDIRLYDRLLNKFDLDTEPDEEEFHPEEPKEGDEDKEYPSIDPITHESILAETINKLHSSPNRLLRNVKARVEAQISQWQKELNSYKQSNDVDQMAALQHKINVEQKHLDFINENLNEIKCKECGKNMAITKDTKSNAVCADCKRKLVAVESKVEEGYGATKGEPIYYHMRPEDETMDKEVRFVIRGDAGKKNGEDRVWVREIDKDGNYVGDLKAASKVYRADLTLVAESKGNLKIGRIGKDYWIIMDGYKKVHGPFADIDTAQKEYDSIKESKVDEKSRIRCPKCMGFSILKDKNNKDLYVCMDCKKKFNTPDVVESKNPEMDFHYYKGAIGGILQSWGMIQRMEDPLERVKERLESIYKGMNESKLIQDLNGLKDGKAVMFKAGTPCNVKIISEEGEKKLVLSFDGGGNAMLPLYLKKNYIVESQVEEFTEFKGQELTKGNVKIVIKKNIETNEWVARWYENGKYIEEKTYYGVDRADAVRTATKMLEQIPESKVNEDEGLAGNGATVAPPAPQEVVPPTPTEEPVTPAKPVVAPEPKEKAGPVKEYLGNNGSDTYFYLVVTSGDEGTPTELQITDANEEVIYTTKDSSLDVNDIAGFIQAAIKEKEIANISTDLMTKYLFPEEAPAAVVAEEEEKKPGTEMPQAEDVPYQPAMESLMKKYSLLEKSQTELVDELMGKYGLKEGLRDDIKHYDRKIEQLENALRVFTSDIRIKEWLKKNDPAALEQAEEALDTPFKELDTFELGENFKDLMEKYGLNENNMDVLLKKFDLTEEFKDIRNMPDTSIPTVNPVVAPTQEEPPFDPNADVREIPAEGVGKDVEAPVDIPTTPEEAKTKIMLEYPEEPFTSLALAFADSMIDNPDIYKTIRQLQFEGTWVNADTFKKLAKVVGELNGFDGSATAEMIIGKFKGDSSKYRIGRDNVVVVDVVVRDMQASHSLEAIKDLVGATEAEDKGEGLVHIKWSR